MLLLRILSIVVFCFGLELSSVAQENTPPQSPAAAQPTTATPEGAQAAPPAKTVGNTGIEISRLKILTRPMTATELEVEVKAWAEKLRNQIKAVGDVEMKIKSAPAEASSKDLKTQLLELRSEELEIVKRTQLLIKECTSKGGDAQSEKTYVEAVSKLNETPDAASYWVAVTATLQSWLFAEDGGLKLLKNIGVAIVIMFFFWIISKFAGGVIGRVLSKHGRTSMLLINFVRRTIGGVVLLVGAAMALAALGVQVGPMVAALGAGGFIIGFALQETLGSFASGMMIMVYRPFDVDDFVKVAGETGTVKEMSLVSTKLLTPDNKVLVIPNKKAWGDTITNFTGCGVRRVDLVFGIGYEDDIQRAIDVLKEVAGQHPNVLSEPGLTVNVHELADSSVNLFCRPWVNTKDYWGVYWELTRQVKERFDSEGISFPFPQRDVHLQTEAKVSS
ncbi:MAG: mechanosensitive ion channel family protein [Planctomycetaceae bacterium]|nr:mechanosensitive ion channel family protein [Planctomycetaceae bacterium]